MGNKCNKPINNNRNRRLFKVNDLFIDQIMVNNLMRPYESKINKTLKYNKHMYVDKNNYWHGWDFY